MSLEELLEWRTIAAHTAELYNYEQTRGHTFVRSDAPGIAYSRAACVDGYGFGRQLGFGPSAISHLGYTVFENTRDLKKYCEDTEAASNVVAGAFPLTNPDRQTLFVARSLGEARPLLRADYSREFGSDICDDFRLHINELEKVGLVSIGEHELSLTAIGKLLYDRVVRVFYPERVSRWLDEQQ